MSHENETSASTTLDTLISGERATVTSVSCSNRELRHKLLSMGIVEGTQVSVTGVAPFGCPISVQLFGSTLALRRSEAQQIEVSF